MLSRVTRIKLVAFVIVTVASLFLTAVFYLRLPQQWGIGEYDVALELPGASGLYPHANVTYRGSEVGRVTNLDVTNSGVVATLQISDDFDIPTEVTAEVRSTSAVGEQYVNLVPERGADPARALADGQRIPATNVSLPVSTTELLHNTRALLKSIPRDTLTTSVQELNRAFDGTGDSLGRLIDSASRFTKLADENLRPTVDLLDDLVPVLQTQNEVAPFVRSYATDLASFTDQLAASDKSLRGAIVQSAPFTRELNATFDGLRPNLAPLLADLATVGRVTEAYLPAVEHILILLPANIENNQNLVPEERFGDRPTNASFTFKASVNNPPVCVTGFEYAKKQRDPNELDPAPLPKDSYCKVPHDDPRIVRGVRNAPCPNDPNRRGAFARDCGLIFDRVSVQGRPRSVATYDPETGRVQGPNGEVFELAALDPRHRWPATWQDVIKAPLRR